MPRLVHDYSDSYPAGFRAVVTPLETAVAGKQRSALWMLLGATSFVLLIACANLTSLLLARAKARHRELSVRLALGCQTSRLLRQILTETTVLTLVGGAVGVLAAPFLLSVFVHWAPVDTPRLADIRVDSGVLFFALIVSFLTGQIAGLMPAVAAVRQRSERIAAIGYARRHNWNSPRNTNDADCVRSGVCVCADVGHGTFSEELRKSSSGRSGIGSCWLLYDECGFGGAGIRAAGARCRI